MLRVNCLGLGAKVKLKSNGKHTTSAQIAVMRKIILTAHSLYKNNSKYDENFNSQKVS